MNREEQQVLDLFQELLDKYDKQGSRQVRDGHSRVSLFGKQLRFDLSKSFPLLTHRQFFVRGIFEELMWMLRGQTDNKILEDKKVYIWSPWNGIINPNYKTDMGLIYGHQWRNFGHLELNHITRPYTTEFLESKGFDKMKSYSAKHSKKSSVNRQRLLV
jgi:thymidylate synthase